MDIIREIKRQKKRPTKVKRSFSIDPYIMGMFEAKCEKKGVKLSPVVEKLMDWFLNQK